MKGMERIGHSDEGVELWGKTQGVQGWRGGEEEEEVVRETKEKKWHTQNKENDYTWEVCAHVTLHGNKTWRTTIKLSHKALERFVWSETTTSLQKHWCSDLVLKSLYEIQKGRN